MGIQSVVVLILFFGPFSFKVVLFQLALFQLGASLTFIVMDAVPRMVPERS
jgi:hypothetical protein